MGWCDWARRCAWAGTFAIAAISTYARAADKVLLPAETFFKHPAALDVKLSPSGRYVGMTRVVNNSRVALLVVDLQSNEPAKVVVFFAKQDVITFDWVTDERMLFQVGLIEPASGPTFGFFSRQYSVDVNTGKQTHVDRIPLFIPQPQPGLAPGQVVVGRYANRRRIDPEWMDAATGDTRAMPMPTPPPGAARWWFDSKGQPRLTMSVDVSEARGAYHWLAPGANQWKELASFKLLSPPFAPVAVADDGTLYVTEPRGPAREDVLTTFDFEAGRPAATSVIAAPGFDFAGHVLRGDPGQGVIGVTLHADSEVTVWLDPAMKQFQQEVDLQWPGSINRIVCRHCGKPDMLALVHSYSDHDPGRYRLYRAETRRWETVSITMPDVKPQQMARVDFQRIKARDGRDLPVWLTLPEGVEAGQPAPAVVLPHGGPWSRGGFWEWRAMSQFLASRGYLVIEPEYRGSSGYGDAHFEAGFKQWGRAMQDDLADALLWARQSGLATDKACIMGAGYGGYATLMGLARDAELFRCGVAWLAITDLMRYVERPGFYSDDGSRFWRRHGFPALVGDSKTEAERLREVSPVEQASRIRAPLLLAYGEQDAQVPKDHGHRLRDALTQAGHPPEYVEYENEGHGWQHMKTRLDFAQRVETFLAKHLQAP